jgi:hypothetical protein
MARPDLGRDATLIFVPYRDDRQALSLAVADLERENAELKEQIDQLQSDAAAAREQDRDDRKKSANRGCVLCGGSLLPIAIFAGDNRKPVPLSMSTLRFGNPGGGFTRSAPVKAKVCSSCGFIHHFIDIEKTGPDITRELKLDTDVEFVDEPDDG